jgi:hypothetical protein
MAFDRHAILTQHYLKELREWDWEAVKRGAQDNAEYDPEAEGKIGRVFLGTVFGLYPSGKYYMPWTTNQTSADETRDGAYHDALEQLAEENGGWIESGEGDPCDVYFAMHVEDDEPTDNATEAAHD